MIIRLTKWLLAGSISGLILGVGDSAALFATGREMFFQTGEMIRAMLFSIATCAAAGIILGSGGFAIESLAARLKPKWRPVAIALLLTPVFISLFWLLTRGPQASAIPARMLMVVVVGIITSAVTGIVLTRLAMISKHGHRLLLAVSGGVLGIGCIIVDLTVLVRLYLPFHAALSLLAWIFIAGGLRILWAAPQQERHRKLIIIVTIIFLSGGALSLMQIRQTQNIRFVVSEKSATTTDLILLAKALVPPPEETLLDEEDTEPESAETTPQTANELKLPGASVLFITVDAMRADRVQPGKMDKIAPNINALGAQGVVFNRAYTALPHTSYSVASFITGKYIKPLFEIPEVTADQETWPEIMRRFRYRTGGFFTRSVFFIDRAKFKPLENKGYGFGWLKMEYRFTANQKVDQALEFLKKVKPLNQPVFTWVHLFEPHEPYKESCTRFGTSDEDRYDCEIYTADKEIGRLIEYVEEFYPGTIIVIAADHGEEFNDHGGKYHGTTLYEEQARVPLVMRVPGVPHREVDEPVNLVDIPGTILSIVDIPVPPRVRSQNMSGLLLGTDTQKKAAFSQLHDQRMVVYDSHKLIWDKSSDLVRLYDLQKDPKETISIADQNPELVRQLKKKIAGWEALHAKTELRPVTTKDGVQSWPRAVQLALEGDESATPQLIDYLNNDTPAVVRQKAAELLYERWDDNLPPVPFDKVSDPVCLAWLWSATATTSDDALTQLQRITPRLEKLSAPWIRAQLSRLTRDDRTAIDNVIEIADTAKLAPAVRIEAIQLLGQQHIERAEPKLIELLENYLLRQDAAEALAKLGSQRAAAPITRYLRSEPFASRRAELADALVQISGRKIADEIALQMAAEKPIHNGLLLLSKAGAVQGKQTDIADRNSNKHVSFVLGKRLVIHSDRAKELFIQFKSPVLSAQINCNGAQIAALKKVADGLQTIPLSHCATDATSVVISIDGTLSTDTIMLAVW